MHANSNIPSSRAAEPVEWTDLREGKVYVRISYVDSSLLNPVIQSLVYCGIEIGDSNEEFFAFLPITRGNEEGGEKIHMFATGMKNLFDLRKGAEEIIRCAVRHEEIDR